MVRTGPRQPAADWNCISTNHLCILLAASVVEPARTLTSNPLIERLQVAMVRATQASQAEGYAAIGSLLVCLGVLSEYLAACDSQEAVQEVLDACGPALGRIARRLRAQDRALGWPFPLLRLMDALLGLMQHMLRLATGPALRNALCALLAGCPAMVALAKDYSRSVLLSDSLARDLGATRTRALQAGALSFYSALVRAVGAQPEEATTRTAGISEQVADEANTATLMEMSLADLGSPSRPLPLVTAPWALANLAFLLEAQPQGVCLQLLGVQAGHQQRELPHDLRLHALELVGEFLSIPASAQVLSQEATRAHIRTHYLQFCPLFQPEMDPATLAVCAAQLRVLRALACLPSDSVRRQLHTQHILHHLAKSIGLEFEMVAAAGWDAQALVAAASEGLAASEMSREQSAKGSTASVTAAGTPSVPRLKLAAGSSTALVSGQGSATSSVEGRNPLSGGGHSQQSSGGRPKASLPRLRLPDSSGRSPEKKPPSSRRAGEGSAHRSPLSGAQRTSGLQPLSAGTGVDTATPSALSLKLPPELVTPPAASGVAHRRPPDADSDSEEEELSWDELVAKMARYGLKFTGDLEEDLELLEEVEERERRGAGDKRAVGRAGDSASPPRTGRPAALPRLTLENVPRLRPVAEDEGTGRLSDLHTPISEDRPTSYPAVPKLHLVS